MVLRGRETLLETARTMIMDGPDPDRPPPVLVLTGPGGSGKTALLQEISAQLHDQPHVLLDVTKLADTDSAAPILDLLTTMVFGLVRRDERRWRFSRFMAGRLVTTMTLDHANVARANDQVYAELTRVKDPAALSESIAKIFDLIPVPNLGIPQELLKQTIPLVISSLTKRSRLGRRITLLAGQEWYGHQDKGRRLEPIGELVALNLMFRFGGEEGRDQVVRTLMAAFLADVRKAAVRSRTFDPVLLLDNADNEPAVRFLRALAAIRSAPGADPDHLTVIATSGGELPAQLGIPDIAVVDQVPIDLWQPAALRDLTEAETSLLASDLLIPAESRHRVVRVVRGLTHGHPGGTAVLLRAALAAGPDHAPPTELLAREVETSSHGVEPAGQQVLKMFLQDLKNPLRADLVTCAAARTMDEAESLAARSDLLTTTVADRVEVLSRFYWAPRESGGPLVMHPLLRRLLLEELGNRPASDKACWHTVFGWLAANDSDLAGRMHHEFALGRADRALEVGERLADRVAKQDGRRWLAMVRSVVTTPVPAVLTGDPVLAVRAAVANLPEQGPTPIASVTKLIVAWRAVEDPMVITGRADLHAIVAGELLTLAQKARNGFAEFVDEATRHQQLTRLWRGLEL